MGNVDRHLWPEDGDDFWHDDDGEGGHEGYRPTRPLNPWGIEGASGCSIIIPHLHGLKGELISLPPGIDIAGPRLHHPGKEGRGK